VGDLEERAVHVVLGRRAGREPDRRSVGLLVDHDLIDLTERRERLAHVLGAALASGLLDLEDDGLHVADCSDAAL
jgi:hypothetical protein